MNREAEEFILPHNAIKTRDYSITPKSSTCSNYSNNNSPFIDISAFLRCTHSSSTNDEENELSPYSSIVSSDNMTFSSPSTELPTNHASFGYNHVNCENEHSEIVANQNYNQGISQCVMQPPRVPNNGVKGPFSDTNYSSFVSYCPDFSDFQDESYSFWQIGSTEEANQMSYDCTSQESLECPIEPITPNLQEKQDDDFSRFITDDILSCQTETRLPGFGSFGRGSYQRVADFPPQTSQFKVSDFDQRSDNISLANSSFAFSGINDSDCPAVSSENFQGANNTYNHFSMINQETTGQNEQAIPKVYYQSLSTASETYDNDRSYSSTVPSSNDKRPEILYFSEQNYGVSQQGDARFRGLQKQTAASANLTKGAKDNQQYYLLTTGGAQFLIINDNSSESMESSCTNANVQLSGFKTKMGSSLNPLQAPTMRTTDSSLLSHPGKLYENKMKSNVLPSANVLSTSAKRNLTSVQPTKLSSSVTTKIPLTFITNKNAHLRDSTAKKQLNRTCHQRRKTVRELLQEKNQRKIIATSTHSIRSVHPISSTTPRKQSGKPSILMLYPQSSSSSQKNLASVSRVTTITREKKFDSLNAKVISAPKVSLVSMPNLVDDPDYTDEIPGVLGLPPFRFNRVNAKEHKPKHYDLVQLEIGNFKFDEKDYSTGRVPNKFKVLFNKRQFIYEFSAPNTFGRKHMACVIVPFKAVAAISCEEDMVKIRVNSQPQMYLGARQQRIGVITNVNVYDTSKIVDVTSGEAAKCRIHKLTLRNYQSTKLKTILCLFDQRFKILTSIAVEEDDLSTLSESELPLSISDERKKERKYAKFSVRQPPLASTGEKEARSLQVCSCRISCRSFRCSCVKAAQKCSLGRSVCVCSDCDNPLNILESFGIDAELAVQDSCLFQNIYQIGNLRRYLGQELHMPCCNAIATLHECIPFRLLCPNTDCTQVIEYSWCRGVLCCAERNPRNHCNICGRCAFSIGKHCQKCNMCYSTKPKSPLCPKCSDSKPVDCSENEFEMMFLNQDKEMFLEPLVNCEPDVSNSTI